KSQNFALVARRFLDEGLHFLELWRSGEPDPLEHRHFRIDDDAAGVPQPGKRRIAARAYSGGHRIARNESTEAGSGEVERRLRDADMRLHSHEQDLVAPLAAQCLKPGAQTFILETGEMNLVEEGAGIADRLADRADRGAEAARILLRY